MAAEAICKYLQDTNRPYSANDIVMNLHKKYGKTEVQRVLDTLVTNKKIIEKVYGKQKVYAIVQEDVADMSEMNKEIRELEEKCNQTSEELKDTDSKLKVIENELKSLQCSMTTEEAQSEKIKLSEEVDKLRDKLKLLSENRVEVDPDLKSKIEKDHKKAVTEYRKRKRICTEITDSILEGYAKSKKHFFEEVGIETDDDAGFVLNTN